MVGSLVDVRRYIWLWINSYLVIWHETYVYTQTVRKYRFQLKEMWGNGQYTVKNLCRNNELSTLMAVLLVVCPLDRALKELSAHWTVLWKSCLPIGQCSERVVCLCISSTRLTTAAVYLNASLAFNKSTKCHSSKDLRNTVWTFLLKAVYNAQK